MKTEFFDLMTPAGGVISVRAQAVLAVTGGKTEGKCTVHLLALDIECMHSRTSVLRMLDAAQ